MKKELLKLRQLTFCISNVYAVFFKYIYVILDRKSPIINLVAVCINNIYPMHKVEKKGLFLFSGTQIFQGSMKVSVDEREITSTRCYLIC